MATVFSCQKDEGAHLLEWIAYYRVIGFQRIVIISNGCSDGSDALLDLLARHGVVEHHCHEVPQGAAPQANGARIARELGLFAEGEWLIWLDIDEYLNIHTPGKRVEELIVRIGGADGIVINWIFFGDSGHKTWPGRHLTDELTRCSFRFFSTQTLQVKTLFRMSPDIAGLHSHRPYLGPDFLKHGRYFVNGSGRRLRESVYFRLLPNGMPDNKPVRLPSYRMAQINHYAVRTRALFALRRVRGLGSAAARPELRYNGRYFERYNTNTLRDRSILALAPATEAERRRLLALPGVADAHTACLDHLARQLREFEAAFPAEPPTGCVTVPEDPSASR